MKSSFDLSRASLTELTGALRERALSAVELMQFTSRALDATHARLNAVVSRRSPDVLVAEARAAQARLDCGEARPLEGIPLGVNSRDLGGVPVQNDIAQVIEHAVSSFRELGHEITLVQDGPPDLATDWGLALARSLDESLSGDRGVRGRGDAHPGPVDAGGARGSAGAVGRSSARSHERRSVVRRRVCRPRHSAHADRAL